MRLCVHDGEETLTRGVVNATRRKRNDNIEARRVERGFFACRTKGQKDACSEFWGREVLRKASTADGQPGVPLLPSAGMSLSKIDQLNVCVYTNTCH